MTPPAAPLKTLMSAVSFRRQSSLADLACLSDIETECPAPGPRAHRLLEDGGVTGKVVIAREVQR